MTTTDERSGTGCRHTLSHLDASSTWHTAGNRVVCSRCGRFYGFIVGTAETHRVIDDRTADEPATLLSEVAV